MTARHPAVMVTPMVRFENVGMRYGSGPEVLRDVTFMLEPGSFTFLTGLSGAGKTTLLKLIYLAEPPSRGLITLFGRDLATTGRSALPALRRRIGVVFQIFGCSTICRHSTMWRCRFGWRASALPIMSAM